MRDLSASYWFQVGDTVRVVADDVKKADINLHNRIGRVKQVWEKCTIDPTCCCAEQVDPNMAVRVEFVGPIEGDRTTGNGCEENEHVSFEHYFAEEELVKVADDDNGNDNGNGKTAAMTVAFQSWSSTVPSLLLFPSKPKKSSLFWINQNTENDDNIVAAVTSNHVENGEDSGSSNEHDNTIRPLLPIPFDGMTCSAFKMEHLLQASSSNPRTKRGIFSYDPSAAVIADKEENRTK